MQIQLRKRVYSELGLTVSVGVSFNKVFAKLGSDMKKPNATTVITRENYKQKVWPLPATDLLYVGRSTGEKLAKYGINTIGELAKCKVEFLCGLFGKAGYVLSNFANGRDDTEVSKNGEEGVIKSISNSTTTPKDLETLQDVWLTIYMLSESVASRLRESGLKCTTVQIYLRDKDMTVCERQAKTTVPTYLSTEIAFLAMDIFKTKYKFNSPLRCVGVRACGLVPENTSVQLSMFYDHEKQQKYENMEKCVDKIRERYGHFSIQKGSMFLDKKLTAENPK